MDFIKSWTFCICITLMLSVVFSVLTPKGSMGRFYKIIISMFIFISFLFPLTEFDISDFKFDFDFGSEYSDVLENAAQKQIESSVGSALSESGFKNCAVSARVKEDNGEITVESLLISVPDGYSTKEVKDLLFDKLGVVAEVKRIGD